MMRKLLLLCAMFLMANAAQGQEAVVADVASDHVDITTGFNGTTMHVFGVRHNKGEIAVMVRGPIRTMAVRRKESVFGAWTNRKSETYKDVPGYYNYAVSVPLENLAPLKILQEYGIGPQNLQFNKPDSTDPDRILFREALLRNKAKQGLFIEQPAEILFLSSDFFRVDFYIPSNVPTGDYEVQTINFMNGKVVDVKTRAVKVAQVGASARINEYAQDHGLLYGLLCVALAVFAGWFSNRVRKG